MRDGESTGLEATLAVTATDAALDATVASQGSASSKPASLPRVDPACYARLEEHAHGGLGRIVRARDVRTGRVVAVKEMLPGRALDAARFAREALVTANLQHPAIVPVYEVGTWADGEPFYAMKLVAGRSLDKVIEDAPTLMQRLALLPRLIVVADALAYAHGQGVIHRDLKPANVLAGEFGETVLIDWGLARRVGDPEDEASEHGIAAAAGAAEGATVMGAVVGTPAYMPPEQALGEPLDERADVYSMGAILYHVLAGRAPYADLDLRTPYDVVAKVTQVAPTPLAQRAPGAPRDLLAIVDKAMARRPADRYASARELAEELGRFQTGQLVDAHRYSTGERLVRWLRQHRAPVAVAALALIVIAVGATIAVKNVMHERDRARASARDALLAKDEARKQLAEALIQKGREAETAYRWDHAAAYYAAAAVQADRDDARWAAALAESRALVPTLKLVTGGRPLHAIATSHDGAMIAAAGDDGAVWRWRADGTALPAIAGKAAVHALAFARDGALAIGDDDGTIRIVDPAGQETRRIAAHVGRVWSLAWTSGGKLISGGEDGLAKVWTGDAAITLSGHVQRVYAVTVSPDETHVGTASDDRTVRIWPIGGGDGRVIKGQIVNGVKAIRFVDETQIVVGGWDATLDLLDVRTGKEIERWPQAGVVNAVTVSEDRRVVAAAGDDRFVVLWDLATHRPVARLDAGGAPINGMTFSDDGATLLTSSKDGIVRAWDTRGARRLVRSLGHRSVVQSLAISPDGTRLFSESLDGTVRAWDLGAGQELWRWADPGGCDHSLALRGDAVIVGCSRSGRVVELAAADGAERRAWTMPSGVTALDLAGDQIAVAGGGDYAVRVIDPSTGAVTVLPGHSHQVYGIAAAADGQTFVSGGLDQTARRWRRDGAGWKTIAIDEAQDDDIIRVDVSDDGAMVVTCGETPRVRVWFPDDDARSGWLDGHTARIWTAEISPDRTRIASASLDGTVRLWDVATRKELRQWKPTPVGAYAVTWSADGAQLAGSFDDGTIIVWDAATGAMRNVFGRDAAALSGGGCAGRDKAGLDPETRAIADRACTLAPADYLAGLLARAQLRLDGVDLVDR